jgi:acyl-CoA synthetase (AMP-forming)/AMP-acid ligase II
MNVAERLTATAQSMPDAVAVVEPLGHDTRGKRRYRQCTFRELEEDSNRLATGLAGLGVRSGTRLALLVRPGVDFIALVFALFKSGAVAILIDPGMGLRNMVRCLAETNPDGFVAIPLAQAVRAVLRRRFPNARMNVTVGRRWFWGGMTLDQLRMTPHGRTPAVATSADDPAAIIFTSGSTGPPKGVLYRHGHFDAQVDQIRDFYGIRPGEIDLPCFPLFGLFNCAMGVTAVIPDMDPSRPARVDPKQIVEAVCDWNVTQTFGSPAIWNVVGRYCQERNVRLPTVRRVLSAGAPVPAEVLRRMKAAIHPEGEVHTPYGATEALPVASIADAEVLGETAARTRDGAGVCVGRRFSAIEWKVIRITDEPVPTLAEAEPLVAGEIGELIVRGPQVTREYFSRPEADRLAKITGGNGIWHRMGDVGYLDGQDRFWFCGRKAHRVLTARGPMYTIPCEAIFNRHPDIARCALVGVGPQGRQRPVIILEPRPGRMPYSVQAREALLAEIQDLGRFHSVACHIRTFLLHPRFPVDVRHNVKISREALAVWAAGELGIEPRAHDQPSRGSDAPA